MTDMDREFEVKRTRDLLASYSDLNLNSAMDINQFQNVLDRLVI